MQYFSATMGEPYEGRYEEEEIKHSDFRLLLTESVFDPQGMLQVLGMHILDAEVGVYFFGDLTHAPGFARRCRRAHHAQVREKSVGPSVGIKQSNQKVIATISRQGFP